jgi:glutathionyl-hydroquinone reductase
MYEEIISISNLLKAYKQAFRGKKNKYYGKDFDYHCELYLYQLHTELREGSYIQGRYNTFEVFDPQKKDLFLPLRFGIG